MWFCAGRHPQDDYGIVRLIHFDDDDEWCACDAQFSDRTAVVADRGPAVVRLECGVLDGCEYEPRQSPCLSQVTPEPCTHAEDRARIAQIVLTENRGQELLSRTR